MNTDLAARGGLLERIIATAICAVSSRITRTPCIGVVRFSSVGVTLMPPLAMVA